MKYGHYLQKAPGGRNLGKREEKRLWISGTAFRLGVAVPFAMLIRCQLEVSSPGQLMVEAASFREPGAEGEAALGGGQIPAWMQAPYLRARGNQSEHLAAEYASGKFRDNWWEAGQGEIPLRPYIEPTRPPLRCPRAGSPSLPVSCLRTLSLHLRPSLSFPCGFFSSLVS